MKCDGGDTAHPLFIVTSIQFKKRMNNFLLTRFLANKYNRLGGVFFA